MDITPVPFINPFTEKVDFMPLAMVHSYVPHGQHLRLEEAARMACARDVEASDNFLLSIKENDPELLLSIPYPLEEGRDELSVEPATLR